MSGGRWLAVFASVGLFALAVGWAQWSARSAGPSVTAAEPTPTQAAAAAPKASTRTATVAESAEPAPAKPESAKPELPELPEAPREAKPVEAKSVDVSPDAARGNRSPKAEPAMRFSASKSGMLSGPGGGIGIGSIGSGSANANEAPR